MIIALKVVFVLLKAINQCNHAALFTLMNKSILKESTHVIVGARCAITDTSCNGNMTVSQFVVASKDMEVPLVEAEDLEEITVMRGSESATTAPNDRIFDSSCQTWMRPPSSLTPFRSMRNSKKEEDDLGVVGGLRSGYSSFSTNQRRVPS